MMHTTTHAPDLVTTLTFPAYSLQHKQSILTLDTPLLLAVPCLKQTRHIWNITRQRGPHLNTLQLIMATITLKRYYKVWCPVLNARHHTVPPLAPPRSLNIPTMNSHSASTTTQPKYHSQLISTDTQSDITEDTFNSDGSCHLLAPSPQGRLCH